MLNLPGGDAQSHAEYSATNCYHKGIDVKILSRILGHADVNITYNLYIHLYGDGFDEMYEALVGNVQ